MPGWHFGLKLLATIPNQLEANRHRHQNVGDKSLGPRQQPQNGNPIEQDPTAQIGAKMAYNNDVNDKAKNKKKHRSQADTGDPGQVQPKRPGTGAINLFKGRTKQEAPKIPPRNESRQLNRKDGQDFKALPQLPDDGSLNMFPSHTETSWPDRRASGEDIDHLNQGMERIYDFLREFKVKNPGITFEREIPHPCDLTDVEMALNGLAQAYEIAYLTEQGLGDEFQKFEKEMKSLKEERDEAIQKAQINEEEIKEAVQSLRTEHENLAAQKSAEYNKNLEEQKQSMKSEHESKAAQVAKEYEEKISNLQSEKAREIGRLEGHIMVFDSSQKNHQSEMKTVREAHYTEIDEMRKTHQSELQSLKEDIGRLKDENTQEIKVWEQRLTDQSIMDGKNAAEQLAKVKTDLESKLKQANKSAEETADDCALQLETLRMQHIEESRKIKETFKDHEKRLVSEHEREKGAVETLLNRVQAELETERRAKVVDLEALKNKMDYGFQQEKAKWETFYQHEINRLVQQLNDKDEELELEKSFRVQEIDSLKNTMNYNFQQEKAKWDTAHQNEIYKLVQQLSDKDEELKLEQSSRVQEIDSLKNTLNHNFQQKRAKRDTAHQNEINKLIQQLSDKDEELKLEKSSRVQEIDSLKSTMNYNFQQEKAKWDTDRQNERNRLMQQVRDKNEALKLEKSSRIQEIDSLKNECQTRITGLISANKKEMDQRERDLRLKVQELKTDLVRRENFKAIGDREFGLRFQDIFDDVEHFANHEWENGLAKSWPFPDELLRKCENPRRTKQHIIQNTLWVILYEKIFFSPFRVIGKEGLSLELQWIEKFGKDRRATGSLALCPKANRDTEKWRYEKMKTYVEATTQPLMDGDPNYKVKQGFETLLRDTIEDILQELGKVTRIMSDERQSINKLVRNAAKLWLDAAQQRCRLFLIMSDSGDEPARSRVESLDSDGAMSLVVVPELRRLGNAQGERLEKDELVSDCKGEFSLLNLG